MEDTIIKTARNASGRAGSAANSDDADVREVTRHIPYSIVAMLWGRAAARCEFNSCNDPLWKSPVTQEAVNIAQKAHIYSFGERGPRGRGGVAVTDINNLDNLLLVCHPCHRVIDQAPDGGRYTAQLLQSMKQQHENRVELVTAIAPDRRSHVILYGTNIGDHASPLSFQEAGAAMASDNYYPASNHAIELGLFNSPDSDRNAEFWESERRHLRLHFDQRVRERIASREASHFSVFALAPQPLLVLLGALLGEIVPSDVYQRHREPPSWQWPTSAEPLNFLVHEPSATLGPAALVLGVSATVTPDRIQQVLGSDASIWNVTLDKPHNDVVKSREHLRQFRTCLRLLLDRIKTIHGQNSVLHVFPAAPVSLAVELGRIRMPKADMAWQIYDQVNARGGFVPAITISKED